YHALKKILFLRTDLSLAQERMLLARELACQFLELQPRSYENRILHRNSFELLLNNYRAAHFAAALLLPEEALIQDFQAMVRQSTWHPKALAALMEKYAVTAETLLQRLTSILPHKLGINDLFFIRLAKDENLHNYLMTKDLHLSQLHKPYNNRLNEKFCNRWVSITSIQEAAGQQADLLVDAQISNYWKSDSSYLCLSVAQPLANQPHTYGSVTLGLLITPHLRSQVFFLDDPALKSREVHTTCERCGIQDCKERMAPAVELNQHLRQQETIEALSKL
ncbi:MAG: ImmA/IrrE family metallo-endopeptidase, partial [Phaeodactylibacter sp.]|nr:ImmA/IrrE family metallo-endopeptidase [Phaeodactylibacter sp.]